MATISVTPTDQSHRQEVAQPAQGIVPDIRGVIMALIASGLAPAAIAAGARRGHCWPCRSSRVALSVIARRSGMRKDITGGRQRSQLWRLIWYKPAFEPS
jgi:hypothetical protein